MHLIIPRHLEAALVNAVPCNLSIPALLHTSVMQWFMHASWWLKVMLEQVQQVHITHVVLGIGLNSLSSASSSMYALAATAWSTNSMLSASST
jgi:hypothetical protein